MKKITFLIIIIFSVLFSFSQKVRIIELTGQIISKKNNSPVHYATITNIKKGKSSTCDSLGFFHVTMLSNDILRINALGFEKQYFTLRDSGNQAKIYVIKLVEKTYKIANVDIFDARWKDFEFEFAHTETEKQQTKERIEKWFYSLIDPKELAMLTAAASIGIPITYKTKSERQKIKVKELELQDIENRIIEAKYNPELVSELTNLNSTETKRFMKFCRFDKKFLLNATEYDLIVEINRQFERYYKILHR